MGSRLLMRVVCISDTHSTNEKISVPDGDVLIHAGDLTNGGTLDELIAAYAWLSTMPHARIIVTPGNHDFGLEIIPQLRSMLDKQFPRITTLIDQGTTLGDLHLWGSPYQPWFHDWAYNFSKGSAGENQAAEKWKQIPSSTSVLITHGPPHGILDKTVRGKFVGCRQLRRRISQLTHLRLHVFGHIHEAHGVQRVGGVLYINASVCNLLYDPTQPAIVLDFNGEQFVGVESV
jgi:predicted phosphodiesterase